VTVCVKRITGLRLAHNHLHCPWLACQMGARSVIWRESVDIDLRWGKCRGTFGRGTSGLLAPALKRDGNSEHRPKRRNSPGNLAPALAPTVLGEKDTPQSFLHGPWLVSTVTTGETEGRREGGKEGGWVAWVAKKKKHTHPRSRRRILFRYSSFCFFSSFSMFRDRRLANRDWVFTESSAAPASPGMATYSPKRRSLSLFLIYSSPPLDFLDKLIRSDSDINTQLYSGGPLHTSTVAPTPH
jgi:hypothetical protein